RQVQRRPAPALLPVAAPGGWPEARGRPSLPPGLPDAGRRAGSLAARRALPQVTSLSLAEPRLGEFTTARHAAMRAGLQLRVQQALNSMDPPTARCSFSGTSRS